MSISWTQDQWKGGPGNLHHPRSWSPSGWLHGDRVAFLPDCTSCLFVTAPCMDNMHLTYFISFTLPSFLVLSEQTGQRSVPAAAHYVGRDLHTLLQGERLKINPDEVTYFKEYTHINELKLTLKYPNILAYQTRKD